MSKGKKLIPRVYPIITILCLCSVGCLALVAKPQEPERKRIILEHADVLNYDANYASDVKRLIGNVKFRHGAALMMCDSAHLNEETNSFEGFGRVHIQEDTVDIYADYIKYNGFLRLANLRHQVSLDNGHATLYTDSLDYDRNTGLAYYFDGGSIVDSVNTLTSGYGQYNIHTEEANFYEDVQLDNKNFVMNTENLHYSTRTNIATMLGSTTIVSDSGRIETTRGVYDTRNDVGILLNRSVVHGKSRSMTGDSIFYDGHEKWGEVFGQMKLVDTVRKVELHGQYGYFDEKREYAFATEEAYAIDNSTPKTLYVGADTLELISYKDTTPPIVPPLRGKEYQSMISPPLPSQASENPQSSVVSLPTDSMQMQQTPPDKADSTYRRIIRGYKNVRSWRKDVQAIADSIEYSSSNNLISLFQDPILWSEENQLRADSVHLYLADSIIEMAAAKGHVLGMQQIDTMMYNQIYAEKLNVFFQDGAIHYLEAMDSVESVLYLDKESNKRYFAMNRMKSNEMYAYIANDSLQKTKWIPSNGKIYPIKLTDPSIRRLQGFGWYEQKRPKTPEDIIGKGSTDKSSPKSLRDLRRFRGADAAIRSYRKLELSLSSRREAKNSPSLFPESEQTTILSSSEKGNSQQIPREDTTNSSQGRRTFYPIPYRMDSDLQTSDQQSGNNDQPWLYFKYSTDKENPVLLTIDQSIGILKRKS